MQWADPPSPHPFDYGNRPSLTPEQVTELKRHPGQWALLSHHASRTGPHNKRIRLRTRHPDLEFAVRGSDLYVRAPSP
jgi:hypothetical protein